MMARYIDADAVLQKMESVFDMQDAYLPIHFKELVIDELPTADVVEVKHGKWLVIENDEDELWEGGGHYECTACGYGFSFGGFFEMNTLPYCPNCRAEMGVKNEEPT